MFRPRFSSASLWLLAGLAVVILAACGLGDQLPPTATPISAAQASPTPLALPDLVIRDVSLEYNAQAQSNCLTRLESLQVHLTLLNRGDGPAGPFMLLVNGEPHPVESGLPPGGSLTLSLPVRSPDIKLWVDAQDQVIERDEGNNQAVRFLPTPGPPLQCRPTPTPVLAYQQAEHILEGHTGKVLSVAFSPDGNLAASGSADNTLRLWLATEARLLRTMQGHAFPITRVRFSPNGATLATGSMDGLIRLWQVNNGSLVRTLHGHAGWVTGLDISADGKLLVSSAEDFTVRIWRLPGGNLIQTIDEGMADVSDVRFSPDDRLLAWGEADGTVRLRTLSGKWLSAFKENHYPALCVAFSPDSRWLAAGFDDGTLRVWNVSDGSLLQTLIAHSQAVTDLAFTPDGNRLATASQDGTLRLWQKDEAGFLALPIVIYSGHQGAATSLDISSKGTYLASGGEDGTVRLWTLP